MTQTYPERERNITESMLKMKEELSYYKTEVRIKDEQIKIKDEIILKFEKEIETLKNKVDTTYNTIIEKGEKRYTELVCTNSKFLESKISNQTLNYTVNNNYGIKPLTPESVISAFDSYNTKYENAFVAYTYDFDGLMKIPNLENVLYGIAKELRDYYGITDKSREKITYNNNGDMTLTTIKEFIRTNIIMNNVDIIIDWLSNLKMKIFEIIENGYTVNGDGNEIKLTKEDIKRLSEKQEGLTIIGECFKTSKINKEVNSFLYEHLSEGALKYGKMIEKKIPSINNQLK
jgi:cob(I)alamin adenosyltransferase